jgi:outer membrane murein-binding lipoprotein Lpp
MTPPRLPLAFALLASLATMACASSPDRQLAERTSGSLSLLSSQMAGLVVSGTRLAQTRAERIAHLHAETARVKNELETDLDLRRRTDDRETGSRLAELRELAEAVTARWAAAGRAREERRARILAGQAVLEAPTKSLGGIASDLAALGETDDLMSRVRFLSGFVGNITSEVRALQKDVEKTAKAAAAGSRDNAARAQGELGRAAASPAGGTPP